MRYAINLKTRDPMKYLIVMTHSYLSGVREIFGFKKED
jgi:hypothetical protein